MRAAGCAAYLNAAGNDDATGNNSGSTAACAAGNASEGMPPFLPEFTNFIDRSLRSRGHPELTSSSQARSPQIRL